VLGYGYVTINSLKADVRTAEAATAKEKSDRVAAIAQKDAVISGLTRDVAEATRVANANQHELNIYKADSERALAASQRAYASEKRERERLAKNLNEVANAPVTTACINSPSVAGLLDRLRGDPDKAGGVRPGEAHGRHRIQDGGTERAGEPAILSLASAGPDEGVKRQRTGLVDRDARIGLQRMLQ
jgi:hypothetical protein